MRFIHIYIYIYVYITFLFTCNPLKYEAAWMVFPCKFLSLISVVIALVWLRIPSLFVLGQCWDHTDLWLKALFAQTFICASQFVKERDSEGWSGRLIWRERNGRRQREIKRERLKDRWREREGRRNRESMQEKQSFKDRWKQSVRERERKRETQRKRKRETTQSTEQGPKVGPSLNSQPSHQPWSFHSGSLICPLLFKEKQREEERENWGKWRDARFV